MLVNANLVKAEEWMDSFSIIDPVRWISRGTTAASLDGATLGPSNGDFAISGIRTINPIGNPSHGVSVTVEISGFEVTKSAPEDAENGNDIRASVVLCADGEIPPWENTGPVIYARIYYNKENDGLVMAISAKQGGRPKDDGDFLTSDLIGTNIGGSKLKVVMELRGNKLKVLTYLNESIAASFNKHIDFMPDGLGESAFLQVWQQNIAKGQGIFRLSNVTVSSVE